MIPYWIHRLMQRAGFDVIRWKANALPKDFDAKDAAAFAAVQPFTMTSPERVFALRSAVEHVVRAGIPGAIVECGVWRGGSMMAVARRLQELSASDRDLYLYDTYAGLPAPGVLDVTLSGLSASGEFERTRTGADSSSWCAAPLGEVQANLASTGYPPERVHFIEGKVEATLPALAPDRIALLRLDTDWYASTAHELTHLYPRLQSGGILIIDDYGHWRGSRQAVDEYFATLQSRPVLHRIDYTARFAIKP